MKRLKDLQKADGEMTISNIVGKGASVVLAFDE